MSNPNDLLQIYKSDGGKYIYVCLIPVPEWQFYKLFPNAVQITQDEMEMLLANGAVTIVEIDGDTLPPLKKLLTEGIG